MDKKEKKPGKGLKIFAVLLLILSLGLIGSGVYLLYMDNNKKEEIQEKPVEKEPEIVEEELDITSEEVVGLFNQLQLERITDSLVGEGVRDYYFSKEEINDDLKLFLALVNMGKVSNYKAGSTDVVEISVEDVETEIVALFNETRTDATYKDLNLGNGVEAKFNTETKKYTLSSVLNSVVEQSKYYGELFSAKKVGDEVILTIKTYYASYEDIDNNAATPSVFNLYKDSTKSEKISEVESGYQALPKIKDTNIDETKFQDYQFTFKLVDNEYKFIAFQKVVK